MKNVETKRNKHSNDSQFQFKTQIKIMTRNKKKYVIYVCS